MRVEVNSELCQGHNRCYALAPELFDVDDYGNAVVIGDGDGARRARGQGAAGVRQLPRVRDHARSSDAMTDQAYVTADRTTPDRRVGDRLQPRRPDVQRQRPRDLGRAARVGLPVAHTTVRRDVGADHARTGARGRLRHRPLHEQRRDRQQRPARHRRPGRAGAADHQRPAVPPDRPAACCCRRSPRRRSTRGSPTCARCATNCSTGSGDVVAGETVVDAAVQYAQSIPVNVIARMLGFPPEDEEVFRGFVHNVIEQVDLPAEERDGWLRTARRVHRSADRPTTSTNPRDDLTSYLLGVELDGNKLALEHVRGSIVLLLIAGIDTTWSAIGRRCGTSPPTPTTCPARRRPGGDVSRSRSSCGPTPRSRWRGWSRTTTSSTVPR